MLPDMLWAPNEMYASDYDPNNIYVSKLSSWCFGIRKLMLPVPCRVDIYVSDLEILYVCISELRNSILARP
jgi:hypothetical protein